MTSNEKDIGKLLRKHGYSTPKNSDEIKAFEKKFSDRYVTPKKWPDIADIISRNKSSAKVITIEKSENKASKNLAMAARDGKKISEKDRQQMNKDKRNAKKK